MVIAGAAISPLLGYFLEVPVLAVDFISAQVIVAIPLAVRRGDLIAMQGFGALGGNYFLESGARILLGSLLGLAWGVNGLTLGIALATLVAMVALPHRTAVLTAKPRPITSLINTWLTLVLLGIFVQLDILIAPSGMSKTMATRYDLAAVPLRASICYSWRPVYLYSRTFGSTRSVAQSFWPLRQRLPWVSPSLRCCSRYEVSWPKPSDREPRHHFFC